MKNEQRRQYLTRAGVLKFLSDEEIASVSTAETLERLGEGDEYVELTHLERGVRTAHGGRPPMARVLPRKAVQEATWAKILQQLAVLERARLN